MDELVQFRTGDKEVRTGFWWGNRRERERLEDVDVDGWMMIMFKEMGWRPGLDWSGWG